MINAPWVRRPTICASWCWPAACPTSGTSRCAPAAGCSTRCAPPASRPSCATPTSALLPALQADPPDAVVIALHGATGEDGSLRGVLDLCGVPYVGCDARAARLAWDKPSAKAMLREAGIPTPDWVALPHDRFSELGAVAVLDRIVDRLGLPLMVKPAQGGSGLGAAVVRDAARAAGRDGRLLRVRLDRAGRALRRRHGRGGLRSSTWATGPQALPAVEIVPRNGVYDYAARYTAGLTTWHAPARLSAEVAAEVAETALAAHKALGLRDLSRVDLIVDAGRASRTVLEVNVSPGMTETSLLPMAVQAAGLDFGKMLAHAGRPRRGARLTSRQGSRRGDGVGGQPMT